MKISRHYLIAIKWIAWFGLLALAWSSDHRWFVPVTWLCMVIIFETMIYFIQRKNKRKSI